MLFYEINPFLRYVAKSAFSPIGDDVYTYDCRLFYVLEGKCHILIENENYIVEKGTLMLWQPGTKYRFDVDEKIQMLVLNFDYTQNNNSIVNSISPVYSHAFQEDRILEKIQFEDCPILNNPIVLKNAHFAMEKLLKIAEEFESQKLFYKEKASALLKEAIAKIARSILYSSGKAFNKIDVIIEYIKNNYKEDINNKILGELVGYHPYYINRLMVMHTGTTLRQYLLDYRMERAKQLLVSTDTPISVIAMNCGFKNPAYFSNAFKAKTKLNPTQYRNARQNLI